MVWGRRSPLRLALLAVAWLTGAVGAAGLRPVDWVLLASGRLPCTDDLGLDADHHCLRTLYHCEEVMSQATPAHQWTPRPTDTESCLTRLLATADTPEFVGYERRLVKPPSREGRYQAARVRLVTIRVGAVADFLYVHYKDLGWPAFNIADSAICIGVWFLLLHLLKHSKVPS